MQVKKYASLTALIAIALFLFLHLVKGCNANSTYQTGKIYSKMAISEGKYDEKLGRLAESLFFNALKADPDNSKTLFELGKLYYYRAHYSKDQDSKESQMRSLLNAKQQFERALRLKPTEGNFHLYLAFIYSDIVVIRITNPGIQFPHEPLEEENFMDFAQKHLEAALFLAPKNEHILTQCSVLKDRILRVLSQME